MNNRNAGKILILLLISIWMPACCLAKDRFVDNGDGTVTDHDLNVMWEVNDNQGDINWHQAQKWVRYTLPYTLPRVYDNWRLPTVRELATLVDEAQVAPAINQPVFPNTQYGARSNNWYWASHQARSSSAAWGLNFDDGFTGFNSGAAAWNTFGPSYAKCVHDE